jgi:hypothetical protein
MRKAGHRGKSINGTENNRMKNRKATSPAPIPIRKVVTFPRFQMKAKIGHATVQQMPRRVKPAAIQV